MKDKLYNSRVEKLLEEKHYTRSNDKILYIEYIKEYSEIYKKADDKTKQTIIDIILEMPKESSITRTRAHYQNKKWIYLPWIEIRNTRKMAQEHYRKYFSNTNNLWNAIHRWFKS